MEPPNNSRYVLTRQKDSQGLEAWIIDLYVNGVWIEASMWGCEVIHWQELPDRMDQNKEIALMKAITELDIATIQDEFGDCDWMRGVLNGFTVDCIVWLINRVVELEEINEN